MPKKKCENAEEVKETKTDKENTAEAEKPAKDEKAEETKGKKSKKDDEKVKKLENVELAAQICRNPMDAEKVIELVGLKDRANNFPTQLSGGEQQRVAIARALAKNPKLLLCDEPTGALDYKTGKAVLQLLQDCSRKNGMTVVIITHNQALTAMADRVVSIKSGTVTDVTINPNPTPTHASHSDLSQHYRPTRCLLRQRDARLRRVASHLRRRQPQPQRAA